MKNIFILFCLIFIPAGILHSQNYNWITPNKTYLKLYVTEDGIYNVSYSDFVNAGISANTINPMTIKVYNKGTEIPIYFFGEEDEKFLDDDYLEFYGTRNYGGTATTYDQNNVPLWTTSEYFDNYSDTNVYWIEWGGSNGLRYTNCSYVSPVLYSQQFFFDKIRLEKDVYYSQGENISSNDFRYLTTEKFRGEGWFWANIGNSQTFSDTFSLPLLHSVPQTATLKFFAYPTNRNTLYFNEHSLQVKINGNLISTILADNMNKIDTMISFSSSLLSSSSVNNVSITYFFKDTLVTVSSNLKIDFFEITYPKIFKLNSSKLSASPAVADTVSRLFRIAGYNNSSPLSIYDIANNFKISYNTYNLDTLKFTGKVNGNFQITNSAVLKKPFRIKQKSVPDLVSSANGADYLLIYHKKFISQAEQLRAYRESHDGFRSFKAEIEDIYDIFNYGIENPVAVRNFTKHVYDNWQLPRMSYICLMGRASLDPKRNVPGSSYYENHVPTYGYPPSDGYFANFFIGTFYYYPVVAIGRLPAYYPEEAQTMVDKIISYENQLPPEKWYKNYTYITGGGTTAEQNSHQSRSNTEINSYINPIPLCGEAHKIYRQDVSGNTTFNLKDSVINDINRGTVFVNFRGHAGSHDWEVALNDPNLLNNGTKLPIVLSLTCFTGENSLANFRGFGERFVYLNNKGAIGFIGTTGWSYAQQGNDYGSHIISTIKLDSARRIGNLTKYVGKRMSADSLSFNVRHTVNCYSLIGDPAATLKIPRTPEFSITNQDYALSNEFPDINEDVNFTIYPNNYGLNADSCKIRFILKRNNQNYLVKDTIRRNIAQKDSVIFKFSLDSSGSYSISVTLDADNYYPSEYKPNNTLNINLPVKNYSLVAYTPADNSVLSSDSVEFACFNPLVNSQSNSVKALIQFDTVSTFDSPAGRMFLKNITGGVLTKIKTDLPNPAENKVYFWRTNCIINNDSSGWSSVRRFVYATVSSENSDRNQTGEFKSPVQILKVKQSQYSSSDFHNTQFTQNGIELNSYPANLFVRSFGSNAEEASYFSVGNKNIYIDGGVNGGLNLLKVKKVNGTIEKFKNFLMNSAAWNDSLVAFLNTYDSTHYLMLLNAAYVPGGVTLNTNAKNKLRQFGSVYCDSIGWMSYFHTWSFIGYLGANSSQTSEMFDPCCRPAIGCYACNHWTESVSSKSVTFRKTSGTVSAIAGPAGIWNNFSWTQTLEQSSTLKFDVYGIDKSNNQKLLLTDIQSNNFTDLSSINAYEFPRLRFVAKFEIDTISGKNSCVLNSLKINYTAPAEITYDVNSLVYSSSYVIGQQFKFEYDYFNAGNVALPGVITNIYKKSVITGNLILSDTLNNLIPVNSYLKGYFKYQIPYFRDSMRIIVEFKPVGQFNETYSYNNMLNFTMKNASLPSAPAGIIVYSDGQVIHGGETVRKNPEIKIEIENSGDNPVPLFIDTASVFIRLNGFNVPLSDMGVSGLLKNNTGKDSKSAQNSFSFMFYPDLQNGVNHLGILIKNESGYTDSLGLDLNVDGEFSVKNLSNFPNPMKTETTFIFEVSGNDNPGNFKLKIYTVSGRLIKEIEHTAFVGVNQIYWDGKDNDGDYVSNGSYLYKIISDNGEKTETQTQKLVVLR